MLRNDPKGSNNCSIFTTTQRFNPCLMWPHWPLQEVPYRVLWTFFCVWNQSSVPSCGLFPGNGLLRTNCVIRDSWLHAWQARGRSHLLSWSLISPLTCRQSSEEQQHCLAALVFLAPCTATEVQNSTVQGTDSVTKQRSFFSKQAMRNETEVMQCNL